jgi:hypothetical protein
MRHLNYKEICELGFKNKPLKGQLGCAAVFSYLAGVVFTNQMSQAVYEDSMFSVIGDSHGKYIKL